MTGSVLAMRLLSSKAEAAATVTGSLPAPRGAPQKRRAVNPATPGFARGIGENGRMLAQRTLKSMTRAVGVGVHGGQKVELTLRPAPADSGKGRLPDPDSIAAGFACSLDTTHFLNGNHRVSARVQSDAVRRTQRERRRERRGMGSPVK